LSSSLAFRVQSRAAPSTSSVSSQSLSGTTKLPSSRSQEYAVFTSWSRIEKKRTLRNERRLERITPDLHNTKTVQSSERIQVEQENSVQTSIFSSWSV